MSAALLALALLAQAAPDPAPPAPEGVDTLVTQAARQYDQNQLPEALQTLKRAYAASPRPSILFNMAQVQRAQGDCAAAHASYARFLTETPATDPNRDRAERREAEMQACLDRLAATAQAAPPAAPKLAPPGAAPSSPGPALALQTPPPPSGADLHTTAPPPSRPETHSARARMAGWALAGVGAMAAGTAAFLAWRAAANSAQVEKEVQTKNKSYDDPTVKSLIGDGERDARWARYLGLGAALAGGAGITVLIVTRHAEPGQRQTAAVIGWSTDF